MREYRLINSYGCVLAKHTDGQKLKQMRDELNANGFHCEIVPVETAPDLYQKEWDRLQKELEEKYL